MKHPTSVGKKIPKQNKPGKPFKYDEAARGLQKILD